MMMIMILMIIILLVLSTTNFYYLQLKIALSTVAVTLIFDKIGVDRDKSIDKRSDLAAKIMCNQ